MVKSGDAVVKLKSKLAHSHCGISAKVVINVFLLGVRCSVSEEPRFEDLITETTVQIRFKGDFSNKKKSQQMMQSQVPHNSREKQENKYTEEAMN